MRPAPQRGEPKINVRSIVKALHTTLFGPPWDLLARIAWCRKQRRHLRIPGHPVIWVRGDAQPWAKWGARHGYFEVQSMDGLPYLRALGAPVA